MAHRNSFYLIPNISLIVHHFISSFYITDIFTIFTIHCEYFYLISDTLPTLLPCSLYIVVGSIKKFAKKFAYMIKNYSKLNKTKF